MVFITKGKHNVISRCSPHVCFLPLLLLVPLSHGCSLNIDGTSRRRIEKLLSPVWKATTPYFKWCSNQSSCSSEITSLTKSLHWQRDVQYFTLFFFFVLYFLIRRMLFQLAVSLKSAVSDSLCGSSCAFIASLWQHAGMVTVYHATPGTHTLLSLTTPLLICHSYVPPCF